jgi:hypothetical protein
MQTIFNPNMQADLPNAKSNCRIEFVLPNWIAELSNWIRFAKLNCRAVKLNSFCQTELPNDAPGRCIISVLQGSAGPFEVEKLHSCGHWLVNTTRQQVENPSKKGYLDTQVESLLQEGGAWDSKGCQRNWRAQAIHKLEPTCAINNTTATTRRWLVLLVSCLVSPDEGLATTS